MLIAAYYLDEIKLENINFIRRIYYWKYMFGKINQNFIQNFEYQCNRLIELYYNIKKLTIRKNKKFQQINFRLL
jgi:hypothetical protein